MNYNDEYQNQRAIDIVFTGLRPGEKLYEELFIEGEEYQKTNHEKLFIVKNASEFVPEDLDLALAQLSQAAMANDYRSILSLLKQIVPEYQAQNPPRISQTEVLNQSQGKVINTSIKLPVRSYSRR